MNGLTLIFCKIKIKIVIVETTESKLPWVIHGTEFAWGQRTYLMGILNVTPDSFSDGGEFLALESALCQAQKMVQAGVDIIDIGGQSTRPQAVVVSLEEELNRVLPIIKALRDLHPTLPISIDTTQAQVAQTAIAAGADIINDISGGLYDPSIFDVAALAHCPIILMHLRGTPITMQQLTHYEDLMGEISTFLSQQIEQAIQAGIAAHLIAIDPGIGFAKTGDQNIAILQQLKQLKALHCPILVGTSRKSFIGAILNQAAPQNRVWGTAASCSAAIAGGADILRIHDVAEMRDVSRVSDALWRNTSSGKYHSCP